MVMAGGNGTRWAGIHPKCIAPILGEPVIARTLRQLRERGIPAIVVSHKPEVQALCDGAEVYAERHPYIMDCAWALRDRWRGRNLVLFADVAYTDAALDKLLGAPGPIWWVGRRPEMFGMSWEDRPGTRQAIYAVVEESPHFAAKLRGRTLNVYRHWVYHGLREPSWTLVGERFTRIGDETSDMDTVEVWRGVSRAFERRRQTVG